MATFGLAHGAWHGGWCWSLLVDELGRRGHVCIAPDLLFDDPASTWETVADVITDALAGTDDPVLVGHSLGVLTMHVFRLAPVELPGGHFPMLETPSALADLLEASVEPEKSRV